MRVVVWGMWIQHSGRARCDRPRREPRTSPLPGKARGGWWCRFRSVSTTVSVLRRVPLYDRPVAVGLAWYDYPASPNAARTLVNDLDLAVLLPTVNEQPPSSSSGASSGSSTVLYGNNPENSSE